MPLSKALENVNIFRKLRRLRKNFPFRPDRIKALQLKKLRDLLTYSYGRFEFYRDLMDSAGFDPHAMVELKEIERVPVVDKDMYRGFCASVVEKNPSHFRKAYHRDGTSGSTGLPLTIYRTYSERAYFKAKFLRHLFLNGYGMRDVSYSIVSPHRLVSRDSRLQRFGLVPRYMVSYLDTVENMLAGYQKWEPDILIANKSHLVQLGLHVKNERIDIRKPKLCIYMAETLDEISRSVIEEAFGAEALVENYGATECGTLGFQIAGEKYLHICHDSNIIELDDGGRINVERGNCIVTDLHIRSFPLIRYRLGDWLETEEKEGLQVIRSIRGRLDDWITWKDGSKIPFHFFYEVMERRGEILQFRIIQERYDLVRVLVVLKAGDDREHVRKMLVHDLREEVRRDVEYRIDFVDSIPPDETGKLRMVISKIKS